MSFSSDTKKELCRYNYSDINHMRAEAYGFLLFIKKFSFDEIVMSTENPYVADRFSYLISNVWQAITEKKTTITGKKNSTHLYTVSIPIKSDCKLIYEDLGHSSKDITMRINRANLFNDELISSFMRGVFLCCGTVSNPEKEYHLEYLVTYKNLCSDLCKIVLEVEVLNIKMKTLVRKGNYMIYLKDSEQISDFLAYIEAPISSMNIINAKILKSMRNDLNRKNNFEVANIGKTAEASVNQIKAIEKINAKKGLETLPEELREVAKLRLENEDYSLKDLGKMLNPPMSKSGVNHRIKRIMEIAKEYE